MRQELLLRLYKKTLRLRLIELEISKKYSEWKMRCPTHLSIGQEAVAASFSEVVKREITQSVHIVRMPIIWPKAVILKR